MVDLPAHDSASGSEEASRLGILHGLRILDTPPEAEFDTIVDLAQRMLGCKIALLSLIDEERQWFKAKRGLDADETPRSHSFCAQAIRGDDLFVVPDAAKDPRFAENPLVRGEPRIRFYAGMPIRAQGAEQGASCAIGTVCVIDDRPRVLTGHEQAVLRGLASLAEAFLAARALAARASTVAEERRIALQDLDITHRQFRQAERMANIGSWRLMLDDNCVEWSEQVYAIHGLPNGEQPRLDEALTFYPPQARAALAEALARSIETGEPFSVETDFVTAQGAERRVRSMGELELREGKPFAVLGVLQDITARHRMEQQLRLSASRDDLTGLANRASFNGFLDAAIERARSQGRPLALALLDLDRFKAVNDGYGHLAGDEVLRTMARRLDAPYLAEACAARLGGDEFVLVFTHGEPLRDLDGLLARLSADLRELASFDGGDVVVSATIGAAWLDADVPDRGTLLHRADLALYAAKRERRGSVRVYERTGAPASLQAR